MIEAVLCFAILTALFEWLVLAKLTPRIRVRVLRFPNTITAIAFVMNLIIHWGTITGSMTAVTAALASMAVTELARKYWGCTTKAKDGRIWYVPGKKKFTKEELQ